MPEETAAFLGSLLDATVLDITAAYRAKQAGRRREVDVTWAALRLTDDALAKLRGHLTQLATRFADPDAGGTWTRLVLSYPTCRTAPSRQPCPTAPPEHPPGPFPEPHKRGQLARRPYGGRRGASASSA